MKSVPMRLLVVITVAVAAFTAACASNSTPAATATAAATTPTATPVETPAPSATTLKAMENGEKYSFDPSTRTVKAGEITITLLNQGTKAPHNFAIKNPAGGADLFKSQDVAVGKSQEFKLTIPDAGTYQIYSTLPGDVDKGLVGKLIVVKG